MTDHRAEVAALRAAAISDADTLRKAGNSKALNVHAYALGVMEAHLIEALETADKLRAKISELEKPVKTTLTDRARERVCQWFSAKHSTTERGREIIESALNDNQDFFDDALAAYIEFHAHCPACPDVAAGDTCTCGRKAPNDDRGHFRSEREKNLG